MPRADVAAPVGRPHLHLDWGDTPVLGFGAETPYERPRSSRGYHLWPDISVLVHRPGEEGLTVWIGLLHHRVVVFVDQWQGGSQITGVVSPPGGVTTGIAESPHQDAVQWLEEHTELSQEAIGHLLGVTRQTVHSWKSGGSISDAHRRRLLATAEIIERAAPIYPSPQQLTAWLETPRGADGRTPADLLHHGELGRARLLATSRRSPSLSGRRHPPRPLPPSVQSWTEQRQQPLPPSEDRELFEMFGVPGADADEEDSPEPQP